MSSVADLSTLSSGVMHGFFINEDERRLHYTFTPCLGNQHLVTSVVVYCKTNIVRVNTKQSKCFAFGYILIHDDFAPC